MWKIGEVSLIILQVNLLWKSFEMFAFLWAEKLHQKLGGITKVLQSQVS